jgi:hypothetical protein
VEVGVRVGWGKGEVNKIPFRVLKSELAHAEGPTFVVSEVGERGTATERTRVTAWSEETMFAAAEKTAPFQLSSTYCT